MAWPNILSTIFNVKYPIIQAPMLGVSTPEMAAAVSNAGGLGSLAVGGLSPDFTRQLIRQTKSLTGQPFAVNLFTHTIPVYTDAELEPMRQLVLRLAAKKGYLLDPAELTGFTFYNHLDQLDILVEEKIPVVSFTFGCLDADSVRLLQQNSCVLVGTATCVEEALILEQQGIDVVAVQGIEAGGHRGTFLENIPLPQIGLFSLLPQVKKVIQLPCIAAGGINDARTIRAAFELGADAVQVGSVFIHTAESIAISSYKEKVSQANDNATTLTRAFSGRWARGIANRMMQEIEESCISIPPYPLQNALTAALRKLAQQNNDYEYTNLWTGQSVKPGKPTLTKDVFMSLVEEYELVYP